MSNVVFVPGLLVIELPFPGPSILLLDSSIIMSNVHFKNLLKRVDKSSSAAEIRLNENSVVHLDLPTEIFKNRKITNACVEIVLR